MSIWHEEDWCALRLQDLKQFIDRRQKDKIDANRTKHVEQYGTIDLKTRSKSIDILATMRKFELNNTDSDSI